MLLSWEKFTLGDKVQYTIDYRERPSSRPYTISAAVPIRDGDSITSATVISTSSDITISTPTIYQGHKVVFFVSGGVVNEIFTITITINTDNTEIFVDTIIFNVVSP